MQGKGVYRNYCRGEEGEINARSEIFFFAPTPLEVPRGGGQNLNCKFKTFDFLNHACLRYFKGIHIQSNYLACTILNLSFKQNYEQKKSKLFLKTRHTVMFIVISI